MGKFIHHEIGPYVRDSESHVACIARRDGGPERWYKIIYVDDTYSESFDFDKIEYTLIDFA